MSTRILISKSSHSICDLEENFGIFVRMIMSNPLLNCTRMKKNGNDVSKKDTKYAEKEWDSQEIISSFSRK
jgi:hypothetical protein